MAWSMTSVVTLDGRSAGPIWPETGSWRNQGNGVGEGQHTFLLADPEHAMPRVYWRDKFVKRRRTLVQSWDGVAVYAGEVIDTDWDADEHRLTVMHREIRGMFSRLPFGPEHIGPGGKAPTSGSQFTGLSKRGLARAVVMRGFDSPNARRRLPIDFGPEYPGSESAWWSWHQFPTIESMLTEVQNSDGGPDVWLEPMWTQTGLEWKLRLGNPRLSAGSFTYVRGVDESPVVGLQVREDATRQATQVWGLGQGSGVDMLASVKELPATPDMPVLDRVEAFKDVSDGGVLQSLTDGAAAAYAVPTPLATFKLRIGPTVHPAMIRPGTVLNVRVPEDEWIEQQQFTGRVVSVEGDLSDVLTVGVV